MFTKISAIHIQNRSINLGQSSTGVKPYPHPMPWQWMGWMFTLPMWIRRLCQLRFRCNTAEITIYQNFAEIVPSLQLRRSAGKNRKNITEFTKIAGVETIPLAIRWSISFFDNICSKCWLRASLVSGHPRPTQLNTSRRRWILVRVQTREAVTRTSLV